jgi:hypothetical protein
VGQSRKNIVHEIRSKNDVKSMSKSIGATEGGIVLVVVNVMDCCTVTSNDFVELEGAN